MKDLKGKSAVIVGAANGIGKATVAALATRGARVICADFDGETAEKTVAEVRAAGGEAKAVVCDVSHPNALTELREAALAAYDQVDIVMNNVGVLTSGRPEEIPLSEWERILNVNFMSVVRGVYAFMPDMMARGSGHIVNTASFAGLYPYAYDRLPYAATKAAIVSFSEGLGLYLKPRGIGVTCLCPGPVISAIGKTMKFWSKDVPLRGPGAQFEVLEASVVGEMVADAIEQDKFMLVTHPQVVDLLKARAADFDGFLNHQIEGLVKDNAL